VKIKHFSKSTSTSIIGLGIILMFSFVHLPIAYTAEIASPGSIIKESSQILLITNDYHSSVAVKVYAIGKKNGKWKEDWQSFNGVIGKKGFAEPGEKREGDGRTPSGIFSLHRTFGYAATTKTKMPYRQVLADDLWIDDINAADYNLWVKKNETRAVSYEKMKREDDLYKYGIVIEYNTGPIIKGHGSAIFLHIWRGQNVATEGCVAVSEDDILRIMRWLDPEAKPLIIMGTKFNKERFLE
jgi:L,D-peptidoglycan transpeptidase YkuD (ErfK/YbiS/YcfS/YnhG family)